MLLGISFGNEAFFVLARLSRDDAEALTRPLATLSQRERVNCIPSPCGGGIGRGAPRRTRNPEDLRRRGEKGPFLPAKD